MIVSFNLILCIFSLSLVVSFLIFLIFLTFLQSFHLFILSLRIIPILKINVTLFNLINMPDGHSILIPSFAVSQYLLLLPLLLLTINRAIYPPLLRPNKSLIPPQEYRDNILRLFETCWWFYFLRLFYLDLYDNLRN